MNTCQTSIKIDTLVIVLLKPISWVNQTIRDHHNDSPPELSKVGKVKRTNNDLPTCVVDRLLKLSCILLVRIF